MMPMFVVEIRVVLDAVYQVVSTKTRKMSPYNMNQSALLSMCTLNSDYRTTNVLHCHPLIIILTNYDNI